MESNKALDIYKPLSILRNFPLDIECIYAYDNFLMVGTKEGTLLHYSLLMTYNPDPKFDINLIGSNKSFSRKPITQIVAIPEHKLLISLSDGLVSVHSITDALSTSNGFTITKAKGASLFVVDLRKVQTVTNEYQYPLRLCIVVKRKLMLFYWKNNNFVEFDSGSEIVLPDTPRTISWCKESLCIGYKNDYSLVKIGEKSKDLFPVGSKYLEPFVGCLEENRLVLGKDEKTYFFNEDGAPILKYPLTWSGYLYKMADDLIYLIGLLPNSMIEVKTIEPKINLQLISDVQKMTSKRIRHLIKCANRKGFIFLCSQSDVIALAAVNYQKQISQLIDSGQFELALKLAQMFQDNDGLMDQKASVIEQQIENIQYLHAFDYFCKKQFTKSIQLYSQLNVDPSVIIGLYPDLLPEEFRNKISYPSQVPVLSSSELEDAMSALVQYLVETRHQLYKTDSKREQSAPDSPSFENEGVSFSPEYNRRKLKQIVDTTLLKCYLHINDALVASLLRLPNNYCHLEEAEKVLKRNHKYSELMILYKSRNLHRKALQLLQKQSAKEDSYVSEPHVRTKEYLQHLGKDNLELIFEYAEWVLREYPDEGLKIFTEDNPETESLPRSIVLEYLERIDVAFAIPYLEHIVYEWHDTDHLLHDTLANKYREKIRLLLEEYRTLEYGSPAEHGLQAGEEPGKLGELRAKLIKFLHFSNYYTAEKLAFFFLNDNLWEERAIVLSKLGNHEEALAIYVYVLKDNLKAEKYCEKVHNRHQAANSHVFFTLLKLYLSSMNFSNTDISSNNLTDSSATQDPTKLTNCLPDNNLSLALRLINKYPSQIDPISVLNELPEDTPIKSLSTFLITTVKQLNSRKYQAQIHRSLLLTQHLNVQKQKFELYNRNKVLIDELTICSHCSKKIGKSAFLRYPSMDMIHYSCKEAYEEQLEI